MTVQVSGQPVPALAPLMRGLVYGDGVFRTLRVRQGRVVAVADQWALLQADAHRLGIDIDPLEQWLADSAPLLETAPPLAALRWIAVRANEGRGYRPVSAASVRVVDLSAVVPPAAEPLRIFISPQPAVEQPGFGGIKHLNRLPQVLASHGWPDGMDETVLCDADGHLVSGSRSTLFWVEGGRLFTPVVAASGVQGFVRRWVLRTALEHGLEVAEVRVDPVALTTASEVLLGNSVMGLQAVGSVDECRFEAPGPVARMLMPAFEEIT